MSFDIALCGAAIQAGLRLTVGAIQPKNKENHDPTLSDFGEVTKATLPLISRQKHKFQFKDYAPIPFKRLRAMFGVDAADYLYSLASDKLIASSSEGKSGAFFFLSPDKTYILKTMTESEASYLRNILPEYYAHVLRHPHTLLCRYFGLHRIKIGGKTIHMCIMNNIFDSFMVKDISKIRRYDLKGSTAGRTVGDKENGQTWKDLDWIDAKEQLFLSKSTKELLAEQLEIDSFFLRRLNLIDYSVLLGIVKANTDVVEINRQRNTEDTVSDQNSGPTTNPLQHEKINVALPLVRDDEFAIQRRTLAQGNANIFTTDQLTKPHLFRPIDSSKTLQSVFQRDHGGLQSIDGNVYYFIGIIDLLTEWNTRKFMENKIKVPFQGKGISAVSPRKYQERFMKFIKRRVLNLEE